FDAASSETLPPESRRRRWMGVLARASRDDLAAALEGEDCSAEDVVRPPEVGTVMLEGRAGGTGRRFNLGEATVTRCVVRLNG
ncbi:phosphonate C-P lyase system protein PhnG, partial [Mycobacterium tuberculosis]|nr:phosphonate C-P lyase system protein PhnG [Mycobacterium tuberculosis]